MKSSPSVIVDTGFLYSLYNKKDAYHLRAKQAAVAYTSLEWLTTCFVFQELFWLIDEKQKVFEAERSGIFKVVDFERTHLRGIEEIVKKYADRQIDLADASLVYLAESLGHGNIITTDVQDFSVYRWHKHNAFNLLL